MTQRKPRRRRPAATCPSLSATPLDPDNPDAQTWAETEVICRADPGFMPLAGWTARFESR